MVLQFKNDLNRLILKRYGSISKFVKEKKELGMKHTTLQNQLNPYSGANISGIYAVCEALDLEIVIRPKKPIEKFQDIKVTVADTKYLNETQLELQLP